jgi:hypothetical protein
LKAPRKGHGTLGMLSFQLRFANVAPLVQGHVDGLAIEQVVVHLRHRCGGLFRRREAHKPKSAGVATSVVPFSQCENRVEKEEEEEERKEQKGHMTLAEEMVPNLENSSRSRSSVILSSKFLTNRLMPRYCVSFRCCASLALRCRRHACQRRCN